MVKKFNNQNKWKVCEGVLIYDLGHGAIVPTADEIYSAVFENRYCDNIVEQDIKYLREQMDFSKYPVDLSIILELNKQLHFQIELNIYARRGTDQLIPVSWICKADHIVVANTWYPFVPDMIEGITRVMQSAGISETGKIKLGHYLFLSKLDDDLIINNVASVTNNHFEAGNDEKPAFLKAVLYPYQTNGWQWLRFMRNEQIGGILADEMGLGKTIQIIALLSSETFNNVFPSLIVCPTTLLENWRREFAKFTPHIKTQIHQGAQRTGFPNELKQYDVVITSYDTVIRDSSLFNQIKWKVVVCDEAQAIKNAATRRAIAIKRLPREIGFAVTGTPIENKLADLWSIMDFSVPGFLGKLNDFEKTYASSIDGAAVLERVISPLILRRSVSEVAKDLPAKIVIPQIMELSDDEIEQYENIREETLKEFSSNASLVVLIRLRLFCTHPFLIQDIHGADPALYSNKYARLVEIADEIVENGAKMIVFTSFNKMNDLIKDDLGRRFNIYSSSIDGRTPTMDRQKIVDEFSSVKGAALLVLNPIAAGSGLNITAANHVIHYNLEWNPAKEDQASARAYRRGQDRPVTIHRLYYANSVEEVINDRLDRKRELAGTAIIGVQGEEYDYDDILNAIHKSPKDKR